MWSDDPVVGVTNLWRSSFQTDTGGATISFQLDKFTRLIVCSSFYCILPKEIRRIYYHKRRLMQMNSGSTLSCHVGSQKRKTHCFSLRHRKKRVAKKNVITEDGVTVFPQYAYHTSQHLVATNRLIGQSLLVSPTSIRLRSVFGYYNSTHKYRYLLTV